MNSAFIKTLGALLSLAFFSVTATSQQTAPDLILLNGKIFTSTAAHSYVQGLAIRGDRIVAAGDSNKIRALAGSHTKQIDLDGKTVIPGINDAHNHLSVSASNRIDLEVKSPDPAWPEMKAAIAAAVLKVPKGTFVYGDIGGNIFHDIEVDRDLFRKIFCKGAANENNIQNRAGPGRPSEFLAYVLRE